MDTTGVEPAVIATGVVPVMLDIPPPPPPDDDIDISLPLVVKVTLVPAVKVTAPDNVFNVVTPPPPPPVSSAHAN